MLTAQVLGLELKQEILRMVLRPPKLGTHSSSLTPGPVPDCAGCLRSEEEEVGERLTRCAPNAVPGPPKLDYDLTLFNSP
ncbi:hypothetical protein MG293_016528 [Ovis ammon polii]|uniref:Uncharacterized protein n=1 Tax=Ovis ammon polii TaxID=230172 RepID=A0AAD4TWH4_OVIAM|nr:hypothetical protein MG293_016528 [Ovis ammon polii]